MAATRDDRDAAARRRDTAGYRMSQAGLIEAGVDAASEDSADEYSSPSGDTFSDMILKLLKQMTEGGDVVDINIYNLLHAAGLDECEDRGGRYMLTCSTPPVLAPPAPGRGPAGSRTAERTRKLYPTRIQGK